MAVWRNLCLLSVTGILMFCGVSCYPSGAPEEACTDMMPNHPLVQPSVKPPIFTISVSSDTFKLGEPVKG